MKVLLDECTPRLVQKRLPRLDIWTTQEMGWSGRKNGELLAAAESQFDVFITTDKNLRFQQNLTGHKLAVVLLSSNQVPVVEALIPALEKALETIEAGDFVTLSPP